MSEDARHLLTSFATGFTLVAVGGILIDSSRALPLIIVTGIAWSLLRLLDYSRYGRKSK